MTNNLTVTGHQHFCFFHDVFKSLLSQAREKDSMITNKNETHHAKRDLKGTPGQNNKKGN